MKKKILLLLVAIIKMLSLCMAQVYNDRDALIGTWKMASVFSCIDGKKDFVETDGSMLYIFNKDGTMLYTTNDYKIAKAKWTLKDKELHIVGNDKVNDPEGCDDTFSIIMITSQKLELKASDDNGNYIYVTYHKSKGNLKPISGTIKKTR